MVLQVSVSGCLGKTVPEVGLEVVVLDVTAQGRAVLREAVQEETAPTETFLEDFVQEDSVTVVVVTEAVVLEEVLVPEEIVPRADQPRHPEIDSSHVPIFRISDPQQNLVFCDARGYRAPVFRILQT